MLDCLPFVEVVVLSRKRRRYIADTYLWELIEKYNKFSLNTVG